MSMILEPCVHVFSRSQAWCNSWPAFIIHHLQWEKLSTNTEIYHKVTHSFEHHLILQYLLDIIVCALSLDWKLGLNLPSVSLKLSIKTHSLLESTKLVPSLVLQDPFSTCVCSIKLDCWRFTILEDHETWHPFNSVRSGTQGLQYYEYITMSEYV